MNLELLCDEVMSISKVVGQFIASQKISSSEIETKSLNNFVSRVDKEAEQQFVSALSKLLPKAGIIGEEGTAPRTDSPLQWIVDPLDGTTNFIHDIPFYCTSVALVENKRPIIGVIYNPVSEQMFSCFKNNGAFLNGSKIQVSSGDTLAKSLLATGFPYDDFGRQDSYMDLLADVCRKTRGIRRLGSAALDLAYVACGSFEAFYEYALNPWDVAAGVALVEEAGGLCTQFDGDPDAIFGKDILASNRVVHSEMTKLIELHF
jgi:myo-inositol-1(or 4)-monophosphatase